MSEMRLDVALVHRGLSASRERAQAAISAGMVSVNGKVAAKPALKVTAHDSLAVTGDPIGYVGRGGLKLEAALDHFAITPDGLVCLDVGASTGGFTECLLRRGARLVYAVDVGRDQLHPSLRRDPRVVAMEKTDVRSMAALPELPQLVSVDVSFISLTLVLPAIYRLMAPDARILALIKPQFEVGPGAVGKRGVVRDSRLQAAAVKRVLVAAQGLGLSGPEAIPSPVPGSDGNLEFLALLQTQRSSYQPEGY